MNDDQLDEKQIVSLLCQGNSSLLEQMKIEFSDELVKRIQSQLIEEKASHGVNNLGVLYDLGAGGMTRDPERAIECYVKAASLGSYIACENLGFLYEERADEKEALEWWRKAADLRIEQGKIEETRMFSGRKDDQVSWSRGALLKLLSNNREV